MIGAAMALVSTPLRLKTLVIGAMALAVLLLAMLTWALLERSGRLELKVEVVTLKVQQDVLSDALARCNTSIENAAKAGDAAVAETRRLVGIAEKAFARTESLRTDIRSILSKPAPARADGKPKDCADALTEIRTRVRP